MAVKLPDFIVGLRPRELYPQDVTSVPVLRRKDAGKWLHGEGIHGDIKLLA